MKTFTALAIAIAMLAGTAARAESITSQLFDGRGNRVGSATQTGDTTIFYDARGNKTGSSTDIGSRTHFYDARGKTGSIRNDDRRK